MCAVAVRGQVPVKVTLLDNSVQTYSVTADGKLSFASGNLIITESSGAAPVPIALQTVRKVTFDSTDGATEVTEERAVTEEIKVFPNPTSEFVVLEYAGNEQLHVAIFNTRGNQVVHGFYASGARIDLSQLAPGVYVLVVRNQTFKLVKL